MRYNVTVSWLLNELFGRNMSTSSTADLVGQTLGGYKLVETIGSGAMATVYKAFQPNLERWVAVKVLHYKEENSLVRFQREAKAIALLRHRNILIVYEYGEERSWPYIVMEYVQGGTLSDYMASHSIDWVRAVNIIIPVAEALAYAHKQGIVHRDVKPSNILLPQPDWPLLADFGLVKLSSSGESVTRTGTSMGTPAYVAPEQARGAPIDARSDMYALGVLLFEMITARLPFDYSNPNKVLLAHISEPVPSPQRYAPDCPPALEQVIVKMMQKSPDDRYQDMDEIIKVLRDIMASSQERPSFFGPLSGTKPLSSAGLDTLDLRHDSPQSGSKSSSQPSPPAGEIGPSDAEPELEAKILLTDKGVTLPVPDRDTVIIGRTHRNTLADVDLGSYGAAQMGISRHHARLTREGNQWHLDDLGSLNGTFVNDVQVKPGKPVPLKNGDVIRCSHMTFVFLISTN